MGFEKLSTLEDLRDAIASIAHADESEAIEKLAMRCIVKAQEFKDVDLEFKARERYVRNAVFIKKPDFAIAMFPWLLKKCDEDRERFSYFSTLWAYKWILGAIKEFASIPLEKAEQLMSDFELRYRDYGTGERVVQYYKFLFYYETGRIEKAEEEYKTFQANQSHHYMDDCNACEPNVIAGYLLDQGKYEELLELIDPILKGKMTCVTVPQTTKQ